MGQPRLTFDGHNIDGIRLSTQGMQWRHRHEKNENISGSGVIETINQYGVIEVYVDAFFSEATYRELMAWWAWARNGESFSFAYDRDLTANTTLDGAAAAAQKTVPLKTTVGISADDWLFIKATDNDDEFEVFQVDSVSPGVSVTSKTNLIYSYTSGDICRHEKYFPALITKEDSFDPRVTNHARSTDSDHYRSYRFSFVEDLAAMPAAQQLGADNIESATQATSILLTASRLLDLADVNASSEISAASVRLGQDVNLDGISSATEITDIVMPVYRSLGVSDVDAATEITEAALSAMRELSLNDVAVSAEVTNAVLSACRSLGVDNIESATEITSAIIDTNKHLATFDISSSTQITQSVMPVYRSLGIDSVSSATQITEVALSALRDLVPQGIESSSQITEAVVQACRQLGADNIDTATEITEAIVQAVRALAIIGISAASEVTQAVISANRSLGLSGASAESEVTQAVISANRSLNVSDVSVESEVTNSVVSRPTLVFVPGNVVITSI